MELRDRLLAQISAYSPQDDSVETDISALLHHLVLFDQVVIKSTRLKEVPQLVAALDPMGLTELFDSGALRIICEAVTVGAVGQAAVLGSRQAKGALPLGSHSVALVQHADRRQYLHDCLQEVHATGLTERQAIKLKGQIVQRILPVTDASGVEDALMRDATTNQKLVLQSVRRAILRELGDAPPLNALRVAVHQLDAEDIRVETNLQELLSVDLTTEHGLVSSALLAIGGLNLRLATMKAHDGVEAFNGDELNLVEDKMLFLLTEVLPDAQGRRLDRVLEIADLPEVDLSLPGAIDVEKLIELRASEECIAFRNWLRTSDGLTSDEIEDLLPSLRDKFANAIRSRGGRLTRFMVSCGAGAAGDVSGVSAGVLDSFVLDRLLPSPGPLAWLALTYPSVFNGN